MTETFEVPGSEVTDLREQTVVMDVTPEEVKYLQERHIDQAGRCREAANWHQEQADLLKNAPMPDEPSPLVRDVMLQEMDRTRTWHLDEARDYLRSKDLHQGRAGVLQSERT